MRRSFVAPISLVLAGPLVTSAACYLGPVEDADARSSASGEGGSAAVVDAEGGSSAASAAGLPCDVQAMLTTHCAACHTTPLKAPVRLLTFEDLTAKSASDPSRTVAEIAIGRLRSATNPMPPAPNPSPGAAAIGGLERWVADGYPRGACGASSAEAGPPPAPPVVTCSSGLTWTSGKKGLTMNPGRACIACHASQGEGPIVQIGGTVYPTLHEPDLCFGVDGTQSGARVVVTDANGQVFDMPVGPTGNFGSGFVGPAVRFPIRAKVVAGGKERAMSSAQNSGDCNGCHTTAGANGAPGRIALP